MGRVVQSAVVAGLLCWLGACAPRGDWELAAPGTCRSGDPPRVCHASSTDDGSVLEVMGVELVPGECASGAPGRVSVHRRGPDGSRQRTKFSAREGSVWEVRSTGDEIERTRVDCGVGVVAPSAPN